MRRHSLGLDWDSTEQDEQEANECIAAIGLRRCQLGYKPTPVELEDVAECLEHFGDKIRLVGAFQDGADFYAEIIGPDNEAISEHLTSYPHAVRGDYDMPGARRARELFARDFPQFCRVS